VRAERCKPCHSKVYLARKTATQDLFAIKMIRKNEMIRKNMVNHVMAERTVLALARNPYVVKMFYAFHTRDHLYLVGAGQRRRTPARPRC